VVIDFCAGAGGPTPAIEQHLNAGIGASQMPPPGEVNGSAISPVKFVLTDLYPHIPEWERLSTKSENISFERDSINAANAPIELINRWQAEDKKVFRIFNLAFHHFDDMLARVILRDTMQTSHSFG
jgi:hypothetical protein